MQDFEKIYQFQSIYNAYLKARRGKRGKEAVKKFETNLLEAIQVISFEIRTGRYTPSEYHSFIIHEPKERLIETNSFKEKVIQHDICDNVLSPALEPHFVLDNYASQKNKGIFFALDRLTEFLHKYYRKHGAQGYILKGDIHHYFASIQHDQLKAALEKFVEDPDVLRIVKKIIDSTPNPGVPIGNQTSQFFALLALNGLDHLVKDQYGAKYYGRYMDDFYIICETKEEAKTYLEKIEKHLGTQELQLNEKTQIFPIANGIDFLGFHTYITDSGAVVKKLRRRNAQRMRRKLHKFKDLYRDGKISKEKIDDIYRSWRAFASYGNCHKLINDMDILYRQIFMKKEGKHDLLNKQAAN